MGFVQIGIGKMVVFGLFLVYCLLQVLECFLLKGICVLVLVLICELVNQIVKNLIFYLKKILLRVMFVVGGVLINGQIKWFLKGMDILVVMFGCLFDFVDCKVVDFGMVFYLVLDEVDQMLDLGFIYVLWKIEKLVVVDW